MITVSGVEQTIAKFLAIQAAGVVAGDAAAAAVAEQVADLARAMVPVETGELRDSIVVTDEGVTAGTDHAVYVEFGTYKMPAEPFMRPAADEADESAAVRAASSVFGEL